MKKQRLVVGVFALLVGLTAMTTGWLLVFRPLLLGLRPEPEQPVERVEEVAEGFRGNGADADGRDPAASLRLFLDGLGPALRAQDAQVIAGYFDTRRMVKEFRRAGLLPGMTDRQEEQLRDRNEAVVPQRLARQGLTLNWERTEIRSVKFLADPNEAVVIARHRGGARLSRMRWWVRRDGGRWRVYDFENLDTSLRISTLIADTVPADGVVPPDWIKANRSLRAAMQALLTGDIDKVERTLEEVRPVKLPAQIEALRWLIAGGVELRRQRHAEAIVCLDRARGFNPDMPCLDLLCGFAWSDQGKSEKALAYLRKFRDLLGDDTEVCFHLGVALGRLGKAGEAATEFRKSLDEDTNAVGSLMELSRILPAGGKGELAARFALLAWPQEDFEALARSALGNRDAESIEIYAGVLRERQVKAPTVNIWLARAKALQGRLDEAVPLFKKAIADMPDGPLRKDHVAAFLRDLVDAGQPLEAYRAAPVPRDAFAFLAEELLVRRDAAGLQALLKAHGEKNADDVWLRFYTAEGYLLERAYDKAERAFATGMARPLDEGTRERFRDGRVQARYWAGKGLSAYAEVGPKRATFAQLAVLFANPKDLKQLEALLVAHHRADPDDRNLPFWEAEAKWLRRDYEGTVRLLRQHRNGVFADKAHRRKFWYRLLRSLAQLKRPDEVRREAEACARNAPVDRQELGFLLADLIPDRVTEGVEVLATAFAKAAPEDPDGVFYLARAKALRKRIDEAAALLRTALDRQPNAGRREQYVITFLFDAVDAGKPLEGYRLAPDPGVAFRMLAEELLNTLFDLADFGRIRNDLPGRRKVDAADVKDSLRRLLEAHRRNRPDDLLLPFYTGELHVAEGKYDKAEVAFAAGMARPLDDQLRQRFLSARVQARYKAGKGLSAYADLGPGKEVFHQLANLFAAAKDFKGLEALIAAHRRTDPNERTLPVWEVEAKWLAGDYAAAVKLLHEHRQGVFADRDQQWKFRERLVRSLARLKRFDEALKESKGDGKTQSSNLLLPAVVHALAGDVAKTGAALGECVRVYGSPFGLYSDPDLGPILRSEPFRALRERYPEPKAIELPGDERQPGGAHDDR